MMSDEWKPIWDVEGRTPSFITNDTLEEEFSKKRKEEFSVGISL